MRTDIQSVGGSAEEWQRDCGSCRNSVRSLMKNTCSFWSLVEQLCSCASALLQNQNAEVRPY